MNLCSETSVRVRYAETDQMGIVYHSNYFVWFEVGRTEIFRKLNLPYTLFESQGLGLAVIEASCRYRSSARYDDQLTIKTTIEKITSRKVIFCYQIFDNDKLLVEGSTVHLFVNKVGRAVDAKNFPIWEEVKKIII